MAGFILNHPRVQLGKFYTTHTKSQSKIPPNNFAIRIFYKFTHLLFSQQVPFDLRIPQLGMNKAAVEVKNTPVTLKVFPNPFNVGV